MPKEKRKRRSSFLSGKGVKKAGRGTKGKGARASHKRGEPFSSLERALLLRLEKAGETDLRGLKKGLQASPRELDFALKSLMRKGKVKRAGDRFLLSAEAQGPSLKGQIVSLSENFAFVRPLEGDGEDIFIPGRFLSGAFLGDEVLISHLESQEKGPSGRVEQILSAASRALTGTVRLDASGARAVLDHAVRYDLTLRPGSLLGAKDGDKVLLEVQQDRFGEWTLGEVKKVFGSGNRARVCADAVIQRFEIPTEFSSEALKEAEKLSACSVTSRELAGRLDLREEPVFTVDSESAKDLDDAISVKKSRWGYQLGVHIADVSHYVKAKSALDRDAFERGTSVYFADRVIPMLPEALSNGVCSLNAGEDKLTFSALLSFDKEGNMTAYRFQKSVIRSKVRGVYREVNSLFEGTASGELKEKYEPVKNSLKNARELAALLRENARARGEMELSSTELQFELNEEGVCTDIVPRTSGEAQEMIEQLMISANRAAAKTALDYELPFLYRVHEKPRPERVEELSALLLRLGISCRELQKGSPATADFKAVLERVKGTPKEALVSQRVLRTMEKARYCEEELGHFGLNLLEYSHFTSPIRRYPDTLIHRILSGLCEGEELGTLKRRFGAFVGESAAQCSKNELRAVSAERAAEDCYVAEYLHAHLGEKAVGIISGATARGVFVRLKNGAEGFVSLQSFENARFQFDGEVSHRDPVSGRVLMVGEELSVIIASADVATGRVDFLPQNP